MFQDTYTISMMIMEGGITRDYRCWKPGKEDRQDRPAMGEHRQRLFVDKQITGQRLEMKRQLTNYELLNLGIEKL